MSAPPELTRTPRTTLKRHPERGSYDRALVHAIIDEALCCHLGFVIDGEPMVLPTAHTRIEDRLYVHGAVANQMLRAIEGARACATFTLIDGLVFARTAFHHSMNFRSVVVFGTATEVVDADEKRLALAAIVDHVAKGRSREAAPPTAAELKATRVLCLPIEEAVAKQRQYGAVDVPERLGEPIWAGVLPLSVVAQPPARDRLLAFGQAPSAAVGVATQRFGGDPPLEDWQGDVLFSSDPARLDFDYVHAFLANQSYWAAGISAPALRRALEHSLSFGAYREGRQIGYARVITDRSRFAYLCDVFLDPAQRGRGLGQALVRFTMNHPAVRDCRRWLLGTRDAHGLYEKLGFEKDARGRFMDRTRPAPAEPDDQRSQPSAAAGRSA
jgi:uncharacterized protein